jgi:NAD(P)-dependent dehydrogenase (short-subunit alcohol dehydrogenase family)
MPWREIMVAMPSGGVVVTGASSGIGEATALRLARVGFEIFAGVRQEPDAERLRSRGLRPIRLDVRDERQVNAAAEQVRVELGPTRLVALVNNAGVVVPGPIEFVALDDLREQLEVNVIGQVAVIQAFLPLLRPARGRIVNVGSIDGRVGTPLLGPYVASKFAVEGLSDVLRRELRMWGIQVTVIEPGAVNTRIWAKGRDAGDAMLARAPAEAESLYRPLVETVRAESIKTERQRSLPPEAVAKIVERAITARRARTRYLVGRDAQVRAALARLLPDRAMDALIAQFLRI